MNLSEVLNVALPELPAHRIGKRYPRLHPKMIACEQIEDGVPTVVAMVSGGTLILRFTPQQWKLVELFNGERSYQEIAALYQQETDVFHTEEQVREFADALDEAGVWYKATLDPGSTGNQKLTDERRRRKKRKVDLAEIILSTWDPDNFLTQLHNWVSFIYTKWFTFITLAVFAVMLLIFMGGWSEIWRDTVRYYTFTDKSAADLGEFWLLFCFLGFFHESAHGLTCKHFGGRVHRMGFLLIYLSPAFFCDVAEVYVYGGKWPRLAAIIAGIWVELMFCSAASVIWWGTPAGSPAHDFAYKIMLITGVAVILINLNPLIKLDGYYVFAELIGIPTIKESSTEYVSCWVKRNVFRLPVDVPYVRPARRWLFVGYALLSGLYSYIVLFALATFTYNIFSRWSPQWAFLPALAVASLILRARLRSSARFVKGFFLDKRQLLWNRWNGPDRFRVIAWSLGIALVLFAPVWRETVGGRFILEPQQRAIIRAAVPGQITSVLADEGTVVTAGTPLFLLRDLPLEAEADAARTNLRSAEAQAREAELNYANLGIARAERASQAGRSRSAFERSAALEIKSPIAGVVTTPRLRDRVGSFVQEGDVLADIHDERILKARIFIPEFQVQRIRLGASASLKLESLFEPLRGQIDSIAPASAELTPGLTQETQYKGIAPPSYYVATVLVSDASVRLRSGMSGDAKIEVRRKSLAKFAWDTIREFIQRKIW